MDCIARHTPHPQTNLLIPHLKRDHYRATFFEKMVVGAYLLGAFALSGGWLGFMRALREDWMEQNGTFWNTEKGFLTVAV
jgi:hypothetical protein